MEEEKKAVNREMQPFPFSSLNDRQEKENILEDEEEIKERQYQNKKINV